MVQFIIKLIIIFMKDIILITDPGSADIDDIFAILLLISYENIRIRGIIATHHYAEQRAKIIKLILSEHNRNDIPVYVGHDTQNGSADFLKENSLFPKKFGIPYSYQEWNDSFGSSGSLKKNEFSEKQWFPKFTQAYYRFYEEDEITKQQVNSNSDEFLISTLKEYSKNNKITVICIAPMHDLVTVPVELYKNMNLFLMGGSDKKIGYNWGICPQTTKIILEKLELSKTCATVISSQLVTENNIVISDSIFYYIIARYFKYEQSKISKAIFTDWLNCLDVNNVKNMCDPLTVLIALGETSCITMPMYASVQPGHELYHDYLEETNENPILKLEADKKKSNVEFVIGVDLNTNEMIQNIIIKMLFYKE